MPDTATVFAAVVPVLAAVAVIAADTGHRAIVAVAKPATTIALWFVLGRPASLPGWLVAVGIGFALVGDVALLFTAPVAFMVGLGAFLVTHVLYIVAFTHVGVLTPLVVVVAVVMAGVTTLVVRAVWAGAAGLRAPLCAYAAALATMMVSTWSSLGGPLGGAAAFAAAGGTLFFIADASLALDKFRRPIPHAPVLTMGVYWLGQLGIVLAMRGAAG